MEIEEAWDDEWSDVDYVDDGYGDEDEYDDDEESETIRCPECGTDVYEDAEQCPSCGHYIVSSNSGYVWQGRPVWWVVLGLLGILAVVYVFAFQWI